MPNVLLDVIKVSQEYHHKTEQLVIRKTCSAYIVIVHMEEHSSESGKPRESLECHKRVCRESLATQRSDRELLEFLKQSLF